MPPPDAAVTVRCCSSSWICWRRPCICWACCNNFIMSAAMARSPSGSHSPEGKLTERRGENHSPRESLPTVAHQLQIEGVNGGVQQHVLPAQPRQLLAL